LTNTNYQSLNSASNSSTQNTWRKVRLSEVTERISVGLAISVTEYYCEMGTPLIRNQNICDGWFDKSDIIYIQNSFANSHKEKRIKSGDVLTVRTGSNIGQSCVVPFEFSGSHSFTTLVTTTIKSELLPEYLSFHLQSQLGRSEIERLQVGGGKGNLNSGHLESYVLEIPPIQNQKIICKLLDSWDRGIRQLSDLIAAKVHFKQGLMQQVLTGKRRFPEFKGKWAKVRLDDVAEESSERNRGRLGTESVMAVTKAEGIVPMRERTIAADIDRYSMVRLNEFAYNPMRLNIGSIARWTGENAILVSPDYVVFRCKTHSEDSNGIDPDFLDQYRRSSLWDSFVTSSGNGSVRVRIYFEDLGRMKLDLPSLPEQLKIANFLLTIDREIELLRRELEAIKTQKKGLMQKLLTGQIRVHVKEEPDSNE
jgi:type I restriction enzyme S subunit